MRDRGRPGGKKNVGSVKAAARGGKEKRRGFRAFVMENGGKY
jgi:hypothetical protein